MNEPELSIPDQLAALKARNAALTAERARSEPTGERQRVSLGYAVASSIAPSKPEWLWHGWILARSVNLLVGRQGAGKTTFASHLLAELVNGNALHGDDRRPPMRAGILSLEEPKDRVVARLKAAGANLDRIVVLSDVEEVGEEGYISCRPWRLPQDVSILGERIIDQDLQIVIVDGLGYSIAGDSHNYAVVGAALSALSAEADRTGAAILGLVHPPKGASDAVTSAIGSTAWTAIPRIVMVLGIDPSDETRKRIAVNVAKTNYKLPDRGLHFEIHNNDEFECGHVALMGESDVTADAITASPPSEDDRSERSEIAQRLLELIGDGESIPVKDAHKQLRDDGYTVSDRTIQRAARSVGISTSAPDKFHGSRQFLRPPTLPPCLDTSPRADTLKEVVQTVNEPLSRDNAEYGDCLDNPAERCPLVQTEDEALWITLSERIDSLSEDSPILAQLAILFEIVSTRTGAVAPLDQEHFTETEIAEISRLVLGESAHV